MGEGLMRVKARAVASLLDEGSHDFLRLMRRWDGVATTWDLGPQTSQDENRARQRCKRRELVTFSDGYWRLTELGRAVAKEV